MATLQNIRSKGPLLVAVIGLALFAFIAGDAWKAIQPHQSHDIGEVNGDALSAQDYQTLVEEYTNIVKFTTGQNSLSEEQTNQLKDEVWRNYVNNKLIEDEANKMGLTVSAAEIQSVIDAGRERCKLFASPIAYIMYLHYFCILNINEIARTIKLWNRN